jgi:hypothetical protein
VESWSPGGVHLESVGEGKLHIISINKSEKKLSVTCQIHSFRNLIVGFETCQVELYTYFAYSSSLLLCHHLPLPASL